jgi:hypothetical protein
MDSSIELSEHQRQAANGTSNTKKKIAPADGLL